MGKLDSHMQKNEMGPLSYATHKSNSKWIKDLNVRCEIIKLLEENIDSKLLNMSLSNDFLHLIPKAKARKNKTTCRTESERLSVMSNSLRPHGLYSPWNSPGQNTGVDSLFLLQVIFPTQGSNPGLPHCRQILYQLSYEGSPTSRTTSNLKAAKEIITYFSTKR